MNAHKKTADSFKTTTAATPNAIKSIAACALGSYAKALIRAKHHAGMGEAGQGAVKGCDSIRSGAEYTTEVAGNLPDSEVFSRPEFADMGIPMSNGLGRDGANRKAARMATSMYSTSRHQLHRLNNGALVLQSQVGAQP